MLHCECDSCRESCKMQKGSERVACLDNAHIEAVSKFAPITSFTILYISPLIQFTWRSEWKRVSEFGHWVIWKDCRFSIVCLLFNNQSFETGSSSSKIKGFILNSGTETMYKQTQVKQFNGQFTINLYLCCITPLTSANGWFSCGEARELIWCETLTVYYGDSLLSVCRLYTRFCGALWDWMSAIENVHYGFGHL